MKKEFVEAEGKDVFVILLTGYGNSLCSTVSEVEQVRCSDSQPPLIPYSCHLSRARLN